MKKNAYQKTGITNPARFWTGLVMLSLEVLMVIGLFLSLLDWSWITRRVIIGVGIAVLFLAYNIFAGVLILKGSKKTEVEGGKK